MTPFHSCFALLLFLLSFSLRIDTFSIKHLLPNNNKTQRNESVTKPSSSLFLSDNTDIDDTTGISFGPIKDTSKIGPKEDCDGYTVYPVNDDHYRYYGGLDSNNTFAGKGFVISRLLCDKESYIGGWCNGAKSGYGIRITDNMDGTFGLKAVLKKNGKSYEAAVHPCIYQELKKIAENPRAIYRILKNALKLFVVDGSCDDTMARMEIKDGSIVKNEQMTPPMSTFAALSGWTGQSVVPFHVKSMLKLNAVLYTLDEDFHPEMRIWKSDELLKPEIMEPSEQSKDNKAYTFMPKYTYYLEVAATSPPGVLGGRNNGPFKVVFTADTRTFRKIFSDQIFTATEPGSDRVYKSRLDDDAEFKVKQPNGKDENKVLVGKYDWKTAPFLDERNSAISFYFMGNGNEEKEGGIFSFKTKSPTKLSIGRLRLICAKDGKGGIGSVEPGQLHDLYTMTSFTSKACELLRNAVGENVPCKDAEKSHSIGTLHENDDTMKQQQYLLNERSQSPLGYGQVHSSVSESKPVQIPPIIYESEKEPEQTAAPYTGVIVGKDDIMTIPLNVNTGYKLTEDSRQYINTSLVEHQSKIMHKFKVGGGSPKGNLVYFQPFLANDSFNIYFEVFQVKADSNKLVRIAGNDQIFAKVDEGDYLILVIRKTSEDVAIAYTMAIVNEAMSFHKWALVRDTNNSLVFPGKNIQYGIYFTEKPRVVIKESGKVTTIGYQQSLPTWEREQKKIVIPYVLNDKVTATLAIDRTAVSENQKYDIIYGIHVFKLNTPVLDPLISLLLKE